MGFQLYPFAVPLDQVQQTVGSRKRALLNRMKERYASDFESVDQHLADADEPQPKLEEVVRHLLAGKPLDPAWGVQFGVALDMLCRLHGTELPCREFGSPAWLDRVDQAIQAAGVPAALFGLKRLIVNRGSPIPFPGEIPMCVGYLTADEVRQAAVAFQAADYSRLKEDVRRSVAEVRSWLAYCDTLSWGLVGFYHH